MKKPIELRLPDFHVKDLFDGKFPYDIYLLPHALIWRLGLCRPILGADKWRLPIEHEGNIDIMRFELNTRR